MKEQVDRALSIVAFVVDRAEFCLTVEFHENALVEDNVGATRQKRDGYIFVKKRLMEVVKKKWGEVGSKLADAKVRLDDNGVFGYGRRSVFSLATAFHRHPAVQ